MLFMRRCVYVALTVPRHVQLNQLHEVCNLWREPLDFIIAQAKLPQFYQLEEWLKKTNIEIELKICTHEPNVGSSSHTFTVFL